MQIVLFDYLLILLSVSGHEDGTFLFRGLLVGQILDMLPCYLYLFTFPHYSLNVNVFLKAVLNMIT